MPNQSDPNQPKPTGINPPVIDTDLPPLPPDFQNTQSPPEPAPPAKEPASAPAATPTATSATPSGETGSAAPADTILQTFSPTITTPKKKFAGGRIIATILGVLLLIGGVGAGYMLTQQKQLFQQKAGSCVDVDCAITVDRNGHYNYEPSRDQHPDEDLDGVKGQGGQTDQQYFQNNLIEGGGSHTGKEGDACIDDTYCASSKCMGGTCQAVSDATDNDCTEDNLCPSGSTCVNNACISSSLACKIGDPNAPGCCGNLNEAECDDPVCEGGPTGGRRECRIGGPGGQHCTLSVGSSTGCSNTNVRDDTTTTTTTTTETASCQNVQAYSSTWTLLTPANLSTLVPDTVINLCVAGTTSAGSFDQAEFKIGDAAKTNTTTPSARPGATNEFCEPYTIKATDSAVSVKARIHHATLGWQGEAI